MTSENTLQSLIDKLFLHIDQVENGTFNILNAPASAALSLKIQYEIITKVLPELKSRAKKTKNEIKYAEADAWQRFKSKPKDDRVTDASAKQLLAGAEEVRKADIENIEAEMECDKIINILGTIKDAHIMFRSLNKQ